MNVAGKEVLVDDEFLPLLLRHRWYLDDDGYVIATMGNVRVRMHALIIGPNPGGKVIDHRNRNRLDNRLENLRWVHYSHQNLNQRKKDNPTGHRCVHLQRNGNFRVRCYLGRRNISKTFSTIEEAIQWRDEQYIAFYGEVPTQ